MEGGRPTCPGRRAAHLYSEAGGVSAVLRVYVMSCGVSGAGCGGVSGRKSPWLPLVVPPVWYAFGMPTSRSGVLGNQAVGPSSSPACRIDLDRSIARGGMHVVCVGQAGASLSTGCVRRLTGRMPSGSHDAASTPPARRPAHLLAALPQSSVQEPNLGPPAAPGAAARPAHPLSGEPSRNSAQRRSPSRSPRPFRPTVAQDPVACRIRGRRG